MEPYPPRVALAPGSRANQRLASGVGVPTPCGVVSTEGITVLVPDSSELWRYGMIYNPGTGSHLPRVVLALLNPANQRLSSGLVFAHSAGRYRSGGPQLLSTVRRHCRCVEVFKIRANAPILPSCDGNSRTVANQRPASRVGVCPRCGAISTRGTIVFVPGSSTLQMCGRIMTQEWTLTFPG